jgi:2-amino-4-hydroxy-6-hydroxymethyldihydropteridine diphosphokinase
MARVYISIGSNVDRERNVRSAVKALKTRYGALDISPVYASAAVGFEGAEFYNLVVGFDTDQNLQELDKVLHEIEALHGRVRGNQRFTARTLDLDILTYDQVVTSGSGPKVPREEIVCYAFVLRPLADLAPEERHPVHGKTYRELWMSFDASDQPLNQVAFRFDER